MKNVNEFFDFFDNLQNFQFHILEDATRFEGERLAINLRFPKKIFRAQETFFPSRAI